VEVEIGDVVADKYRVESVLGRGGMGYVVAANHAQLDRRVAIKLLNPEYCESADAVARFLREARASVRIESEHVAKVLDVGTLDSGAPYMVMELLEGQDLAHELRARSVLPVDDAIDYVLQACEALAEAHALGIVHRDLKPANLFKTCRTDGSPLIKVLDFGISKALVAEGQAAISLTSSQDLVGSPPYMSPEQVRRPKSVDVRSDIWSLGVILHEFLGGRAPFAADAPMSVLAAVVSDPPESLRSLRPDLPETLYDVVSKCLEKDPSDRYQEILDLVDALTPCAPDAAKSAFSRIKAIVQSAKRRAQLQGQGRGEAVGEVATLPSPSPSPRFSGDARRKWELKENGSGGNRNDTQEAGQPLGLVDRKPRRRGLLVLGAALAIGSIATVMANRSEEVRTELGVVRGGLLTPPAPPLVSAPALSASSSKDSPAGAAVSPLPATPPPAEPVASAVPPATRGKNVVHVPSRPAPEVSSKDVNSAPDPAATPSAPPPPKPPTDLLEGRH
jgi:serine/threonine protein kinase